MNAPAYNPAAGGPSAIDAQPPSGERERVVTALNDAAHDLEQGRLTWITSTSLRAAADMLAADAQALASLEDHLNDQNVISKNWKERTIKAQQVAVPHGFKLVPIKPTPEMYVEGAKAQYRGAWSSDEAEARSVYAAMLAAAPQPPQVDAPHAREMSKHGCQCEACKRVKHASDCNVHNAPAYPNGHCDCEALPVRELSDAEIDAIFAQHLSVRAILNYREFARAVLAARG